MKKLLIIFLFFTSAAVSAECYDSSKNLSNPAEVASVLACMQYEINQLKKSSGTANAAGKMLVQPSGQVTASQTVKGIQYQLEQCKRNGSTLSCSFTLTSLDKEIFEQIYAVKAFDELGGEYETRSPYFVKGKNSSKKLMARVPVKLMMEFINFDKNAKQLVKLGFRSMQGTLEFKNVTVR